MKKITHLIFSGNALRSICFLGILRYIYFNKMDLDIRNVMGTSMGSFFALAFAMKIPIDILETYVKETSNCKECTYINKEDIGNLFYLNGFDKTETYMKRLKKYIKEKYDVDDLTFLELSKKTGINLYVSSTNINTCKNFIFNINDSPNVSVFDAVSSSMTLPLISQPVYIDGYYYIDGGLTNNFPISYFKDTHRDNILGVAIVISDDFKISKIPKDTKDIPLSKYIMQVLQLLSVNSAITTFINKIEDKDDVLLIQDSPIEFMVNLEITKDYIRKKITEEEIDKLIFQGYKEIHNYMKNRSVIQEDISSSVD